jgi:hypothetical protein
VTHDTGRSTTPQKSSRNINDLQGQKSPPSTAGKAPLELLGGGTWRWPSTLTFDPAVLEKIRRAEIGDRIVHQAADLKSRRASLEKPVSIDDPRVKSSEAAAPVQPAILFVYDGRDHIGEVIELDSAHRACDAGEKLIGVFRSRIEAVRAIPAKRSTS